MKLGDRMKAERATKAALEAAADNLSAARRSVNSFAAATAHTAAAFALLAASVDSHIVAMQRLRAQLLTQAKRKGKDAE